jgi:hypothetical protein
VGSTAALLTARRHVWLLSLVCLTVIAAHADYLIPQLLRDRTGRVLERLGPGRAGAVGKVLVGAWVAVLLVDSFFSPDWDPPPRPDDAARALQRAHTGGRVLNCYEGSSYLQWRLAGHPPLYVDLLNAYPDRVTIDLQELVFFTPRGRALLDELRIEWVVLTASIRVPLPYLPLARFLTQSPEWAVVYSDDAATVWARRAAAPQ